MPYTLFSNGEDKFITVYVPGGVPQVAAADHPNFDKIVAKAEADELDGIGELFDIAASVATKFTALSERVTARHGRLYLDGDEVENALTKQVLRFLDEGVEDWKPLVSFFEKVLANPNDHSREQLYSWLDRHDFTLTPEGDIVAYKGVRKAVDGSLVSVHAGSAIVDGEPVNGQVPNAVGSVVEMARGDVHHNPAQGCSRGLHCATYDYAKDWSQGAVLEVHVNPRDVVSVPTDCNWQKVRACRYTVARVIDAPYNTAVLDVDGSDHDDDAYTEDED